MKKLFLALFMVISASLYAETIKLNPTNTLALRGYIDANSQKELSNKLIELNKLNTNDTIYLLVNSPGGQTASAMGMANDIVNSRRKVVSITVTAISNAFNIVQLIPGERLITNNSSMMTHNAYYTTLKINSKRIAQVGKEIQFQLSIYAFIAQRLKMSYEEYEAVMDVESYIKAKDLIDVNMADRMVNTVCSKELILNGDCSAF